MNVHTDHELRTTYVSDRLSVSRSFFRQSTRARSIPTVAGRVADTVVHESTTSFRGRRTSAEKKMVGFGRAPTHSFRLIPRCENHWSRRNSNGDGDGPLLQWLTRERPLGPLRAARMPRDRPVRNGPRQTSPPWPRQHRLQSDRGPVCEGRPASPGFWASLQRCLHGESRRSVSTGHRRLIFVHI